MNDRQQAHVLLELVPEEKVAAVRGLLEVLVDRPLSEYLGSLPADDEELSEETIASIEEARASLRRGEGIPHEEVLREFGLSNDR